MPWAHTEPHRKIIHTATVECALFNQTQSPRDCRLGAVPSRRERCGFRSAPQTRPIACLFRSRCGRIETDIPGERLFYRTDGAAINHRRPYGGKKQTIIRRIAAEPCSITCVKGEHGVRKYTQHQAIDEPAKVMRSENRQPFAVSGSIYADLNSNSGITKCV